MPPFRLDFQSATLCVDSISTGNWAAVDDATSKFIGQSARSTFLAPREKDDVRAKFKVRLLYEEGEFLPRSTSTAVAWDRKAEEQGLVAAKLIDTAIESFSTPGNAYDSYFENTT